MKKKTNTARTVALTGIFGAVALVLSFFEKFMLAALPLPPGVKPGLSNIAVLFTLRTMGLPFALGLVVIKAGFSLLMSGATAAVMSLCGGVCSVLTMFLLCKISKNGLSYTGISAVSAVMHNFGQLAAASVLIGTSVFKAYAPILILSGIIFGTVTGILLNTLEPALEKFSYKLFSNHTQSGTERG